MTDEPVAPEAVANETDAPEAVRPPRPSFRTWLAARGQHDLVALLDSGRAAQALAVLWLAEAQSVGTEVLLDRHWYRAERATHWPSGEPDLTWRLIGTESFLPSVSIQLAHERGALGYG